MSWFLTHHWPISNSCPFFSHSITHFISYSLNSLTSEPNTFIEIFLKIPHATSEMHASYLSNFFHPNLLLFLTTLFSLLLLISIRNLKPGMLLGEGVVGHHPSGDWSAGGLASSEAALRRAPHTAQPTSEPFKWMRSFSRQDSAVFGAGGGGGDINNLHTYGWGLKTL